LKVKSKAIGANRTAFFVFVFELIFVFEFGLDTWT